MAIQGQRPARVSAWRRVVCASAFLVCLAGCAVDEPEPMPASDQASFALSDDTTYCQASCAGERKGAKRERCVERCERQQRKQHCKDCKDECRTRPRAQRAACIDRCEAQVCQEPSSDAGSTADAGPVLDAGSDAGSLADAGDAGSIDAGSIDASDAATDSGPQTDTTPAPDTGVPPVDPPSDAGPLGDPVGCRACQRSQCSNYFDLDMFGGCFVQPNPEFGADPNDPTFIQNCIDAVECAHTTHCASDPVLQATTCYCGSLDLDRCFGGALPGADGPCRAQWERATRSTDPRDVAARLSDFSFPSAWAYFELQCEFERCATECGAAQCGNGVREASEACDDGNLVPGDGCESNCHLTPRCGNRVTEAGEQCDDGNLGLNDGCEPNCTLTPVVCGNGLHQADEQCDDGNQVSGDGCEPDCTLSPRCGDQVVTGSEQCDDGNSISHDGCEPNCTLTPVVCGNGLRQGAEQCDDGNQVSDDGCEPDCTLTPVVCGNGRLERGELCDDGNTIGGDGCEADCSFSEPGACATCRNQHCRDFEGIDLVSGCFERVNADFGGDPADPLFLQACVDAVSCGQVNHCANDPLLGGAHCYCGSRNLDDCFTLGPAPDAACVAEWQRAARSSTHQDVLLRFSDLAFPSGWAFFLLECERRDCAEVCL